MNVTIGFNVDCVENVNYHSTKPKFVSSIFLQDT